MSKEAGGVEEAKYTIGAAALRSGVSPDLIRAWERRYGVVEPGRSRGGTRLYSDADILRLRLLRQATGHGVSIAQAAMLTTRELMDLGGGPDPAGDDTFEGDEGGRIERITLPILKAVEEMDGAGIQAGLGRALVTLGFGEFASRVATPLLHRVGDLWESGSICPAHEHVFSMQLRLLLHGLLESLNVRGDGPVAVVTTLGGERHEIGAMFAAITTAASGFHVAYLGSDLPALDIARASAALGARLLLLSVIQSVDATELRENLGTLRRAIDQDAVILVGGHASSAHAEVLRETGARQLPNLSTLALELESIGLGSALAVASGEK